MTREDITEKPVAIDKVYQKSSKGPKPKGKCFRCGNSTHPKKFCPAKDSTCRKCGLVGHWAKFCKTKFKSKQKAVQSVNENTEFNACDSDDCRDLSDSETELTANVNYSFIGKIYSTGKQNSQWKVQLGLNGNDNKVNFIIDTGADVTILPEKVFKDMGLKIKLEKPSKSLHGANKSKLLCVGQFCANLKSSMANSDQMIYVVKDCTTPLLGKPAIEALDIVRIVNNVQVESKHPKLFSGLGVMEGKYDIKLSENYTPYAVNAPRKVSSVPLYKMIKKKLYDLETQGVIFKVSEPTEFCAPIVPVPKRNKNGDIVDVRICVDYTKLNKYVQTERYMIPREMLSRLPGAKVFSKLDANSWFHQIPLTDSSQLLTTFISPFGRFAYRRIPFGITSAPEHAQKRFAQLLEDLEGVEVFIDDVLIHAPNQKLHDEGLEAVLSRLEAAVMTLNKDKCKISCREVNFVGHIVSDKGISPDPDKTKGLREMATPQDIHDVRGFLGVVNQFSKFSPSLSTLTQPIRELL